MKEAKEISENEVQIDGCLYRKVKEPKPEFKDGDWVIGIKECKPYHVSRIEHTENWSNKKYNDYNGHTGVIAITNDFCRHATPEEIEAHLKKICDEKYLGKKVRCLFADKYPSNIDIQEQRVVYFDEYLPAEDELRYTDGSYWVCVYKQGKFAEILPDKKKLPKTKSEFNKFLGDWNNRHTSTTEEFLSQYE